MSVNAVSGTSLRHDLVSALRQARAASAPQVDASAFSTATQDSGATQATSGSTQATGSAATPALSSDLMASLLQLQSDFSQMGLQTGVTSPTDSDDGSKATATSSGADASQAASGAGPVHHHHGHHARSQDSDAASDAQAAPSAATTDASSASGATTGASTSNSNPVDGLQALLQQVTKAVAAYATGGPIGVAAAALTTSTKV